MFSAQFLLGLIQSAAAGAAGAVGSVGAKYFLRLFREKTTTLKPDELRRLLEELGATSPAAIRTLVLQGVRGDHRVTADQVEDLYAVLVSIARGATFLNSQGDPRSTYLGVKDVLEALLADVQPRRKAGEKVADGHEWVLRRFLGMGSFGEVWLADHGRAPGLPKRAYKFFTHQDARPWLEREKDTLLAVMEKLEGHPQVVQLLDVNVTAKGFPFLAFEYVEGGSLEDWLLAPAAQPALRRAEVMRGVVRAVAAAHKQGVFHLDLKPANILLTRPPDVQPKITDFGLSRVDAAAAAAGADILPAGTPMYWPPEAQRPFADHSPARFDVFALGVIWYQLLVGRLDRPPYDFADELVAAGADSHTVRLVARCLAHPARRFADAAELADHMDQADLPVWAPVPAGLYDVQHLVREYVGTLAK